MKQIVVDGATSMLGIALINECILNKIEVLALARTDSKRLSILPKSDMVHVVKCRQEDLKNLQIESQGRYDAYYHFAWGNTFNKDRINVFLQEPNIQYTMDAVCLAKRLGCKLFVGAGSQAEYGRVDGKIGSNTPVNPEVAYGIAKYAAGKMAKVLCEELEMRYIWTRTFSVYGIGDNSTTLVMSAIAQLLKGEKPSFTKAEQRWDYLYSKDAGKAFRLIGEKGKGGKTYCVASGVSRRLKDYIYIIRDAIDESLPLGIGDYEYAPQQVMNLVADISSLKEDTGFEPEYTFEAGIRETIDWYRNKDQRRYI